MTDGITLHGRHSWRDFDLYVKTRDIGLPERKSIRQTVPYCNGSYDYSALGGEVAYNDRTLTYTFDITGDSPAELEEIKASVCAWLCSAQEAELRDDICPDWYFVGSLGALSWTPDENGLQGELEASFVCYPFKLARIRREAVLTGRGPLVVCVSGAGAAVTAVSDAATSVTDGTLSTALTAGEETLLAFTLRHGVNTITQTGSGCVRLLYREEAI